MRSSSSFELTSATSWPVARCALAAASNASTFELILWQLLRTREAHHFVCMNEGAGFVADQDNLMCSLVHLHVCHSS